MARKRATRGKTQQNLPTTRPQQRKKLTQSLNQQKKSRKINTNADVHQEERLRKRREADRLRRQKIKDDPDRHAIHLEKERMRYQKSKRDGKIKSINECNPREQQARRAKQSEWKRNSRIKIKVLESKSETTSEVNNNSMTKQAKVGAKRRNKNTRKCYRDNQKILEENKRLKKSVDKYRKRIERAKKKKPLSSSPQSIVQKFLNGRRVDPDINKRLISNEVLTQQLKASYRDSKSDKFKQILGRVLTGKVMKKYRNLTFAKKHIARVESSKIPRHEDPLKFIRQQNQSVIFRREQVKKFFLENSNVDPGKRQCKRINGELISKHYLTASIKDLYRKFCSETSIPVSYPFFARYRPSYCVEPKVTARDTCACFVHENFKLLVNALHRIKIVKQNSTQSLISSITCSRRSEKCFSRECTSCGTKEVDVDIQDSHRNDEMSYLKWGNFNGKTPE